MYRVNNLKFNEAVKLYEQLNQNKDVVYYYNQKLKEELDKNTDLYNAKKEGIIETAINMINEGVDKTIISKVTGLEISEINKLI